LKKDCRKKPQFSDVIGLQETKVLHDSMFPFGQVEALVYHVHFTVRRPLWVALLTRAEPLWVRPRAFPNDNDDSQKRSIQCRHSVGLR